MTLIGATSLSMVLLLQRLSLRRLTPHTAEIGSLDRVFPAHRRDHP